MFATNDINATKQQVSELAEWNECTINEQIGRWQKNARARQASEVLLRFEQENKNAKKIVSIAIFPWKMMFIWNYGEKHEIRVIAYEQKRHIQCNNNTLLGQIKAKGSRKSTGKKKRYKATDMVAEVIGAKWKPWDRRKTLWKNVNVISVT